MQQLLQPIKIHALKIQKRITWSVHIMKTSRLSQQKRHGATILRPHLKRQQINDNTAGDIPFCKLTCKRQD